jgi:prepilin-type processing-associated H-X9-DG protein
MSVLRKASSEISAHRGFSIIELLVIISSLAVLTSIFMPSLWKAREVGYKTKCATNLRTMGFATLMYIENNFQMFPDLVYTFGPGASGTKVIQFQPKKAITTGLNNYNSESLVCPSDKEDYVVQYLDEDDETQYTRMSYGYNLDMLVQEMPYENLKTPAELAVFFDGCPYGRGNKPDKGPWQGHWDPDRFDFATNCVIRRHMDRANVLYADWHVEQQAEITEEMIYDVYYQP